MKDIKNILFLAIALILISGCSVKKVDSPKINYPDARILIAGNYNGKFLKTSQNPNEKTCNLAQISSFISDTSKKQVGFPISMVMVGNTTGITDEKDIKKAEILAKCAKMIGFKANLPAALELNDPPEFAQKRSEFDWTQVVTNVKPREGKAAPAEFKEYYSEKLSNGKIVYYVNFITQSYFNKHPILNDYYVWLDPREWLTDFARTIRLRDILVVNYQTFSPADFVNLYKIQESSRISFLIIERTLYGKLADEERRPPEIKDVNFIMQPGSISEVQIVDVTWDKKLERWKVENQLIAVGTKIDEDKAILEVMDEYVE
jgi:hypothetical protein